MRRMGDTHKGETIMIMNFFCEKCKQEYSRPTYTNTSTKNSKEFWREKEGAEYGLCPDCWKAEKDEKRQKAMEDACFPKLEGSEKQIFWAEKIRFEKYELGQDYVSSLKPKGVEAYERLFGMTEARFWIDNRNKGFKELLTMVAFMAPADVDAEIKNEEEKECKAKIRILRPEKPVDETPVEIRVTETTITVISKKDERIIETCKDAGYSWVTGSGWVKKISFRTGSPVDRAAEVGNKLLSMGYPVAIDNVEAADKAVNAGFELEHTRWISVPANTKGELHIGWQRRDESLYETARSLPGSSYSSPSVVVPVKYFREVEDFAELYGFRFGPGALKAIEEYKTNLEITTVKPEKAPEQEKPKRLEGIMRDIGTIEDLKDD